MASAQTLHASNLNPDLGEALSARVKDPLWFLARQWQTGEFEAENGGAPALATVRKTDWPLATIAMKRGTHALDRARPLEAALEAEDEAGDASAWAAEALEYRASVSSERHELTMDSYHGRDLDWWHFDLSRRERAGGAQETVRMVPGMLNVCGAPHPRWWRFENGDTYLDAPEDPEPNVLSALMPEFIYADIADWNLFPLPIEAGSVREIENVSIVDSFGVVTELEPAGGGKWRCFAQTGEDGPAQSDLLFVPNVAYEVLDNETLEDVLFQRDEASNLVWAIERLVTYEDGAPVRRGDANPSPTPEPDAVPPGFEASYRLQSTPAANFIPYVPVFSLPGSSGETYLRRARTDETASLARPQYEGVLLAASTRLNEEELGVTGVRVRRIKRSVQASDGSFVVWVARVRDVTEIEPSGAGLRFDFTE